MSSVFIGLLRGINVSGKNIIKMVNLRESLSSIKGIKSVETYIQSGNIIIQSTKSEIQLETAIHEKILKDFQYDVPVMVRPGSYFKKVLESYPFETSEISKCYFTFLEKMPQKGLYESLHAKNTMQDELDLGEKVLYLRYREKYSKSKLVNNLFERTLKQKATTRNFRTTAKLVQMAFPIT